MKGVIITMLLALVVGCQKQTTMNVVDVAKDSKGCFMAVVKENQQDTIRKIAVYTSAGELWDCTRFLSIRDTLIGRNIVISEANK